MSARCIKFWYDVADQANIRAQIAARAVSPSVSGVIDCTQIKASPEVQFDFVNRKHFHSVNVQMICDEEMPLINEVGRWPRSTYDSFI